jgi:hypothetical protein
MDYTTAPSAGRAVAGRAPGPGPYGREAGSKAVALNTWRVAVSRRVDECPGGPRCQEVAGSGRVRLRRNSIRPLHAGAR